MNKKVIMVIAIIVAMMFCAFSAGCVGADVNEKRIDTPIEKNNSIDSKTVEKSWYSTWSGENSMVIVDVDTKVMYLYCSYGFSTDSRTITPLYNADGTPKLYNPETCTYDIVYMF